MKFNHFEKKKSQDFEQFLEPLPDKGKREDKIRKNESCKSFNKNLKNLIHPYNLHILYYYKIPMALPYKLSELFGNKGFINNENKSDWLYHLSYRNY
jgi:hypothetical protein